MFENLPLAGRNLELTNLLLPYVSDADTCVQRQGTWLSLKSCRNMELDEISTSCLELRSHDSTQFSLSSDSDTCNNDIFSIFYKIALRLLVWKTVAASSNEVIWCVKSGVMSGGSHLYSLSSWDGSTIVVNNRRGKAPTLSPMVWLLSVAVAPRQDHCDLTKTLRKTCRNTDSLG